MTRPLVIPGANLVLRAAPGTEDRVFDIYVREEVIDNIVYRTMELELTPEEQQDVAKGGTLRIRQMGTAWVPVAAWIEPVFRKEDFFTMTTQEECDRLSNAG